MFKVQHFKSHMRILKTTATLLRSTEFVMQNLYAFLDAWYFSKIIIYKSESYFKFFNYKNSASNYVEILIWIYFKVVMIKTFKLVCFKADPLNSHIFAVDFPEIKFH